MKFKLKVKDEGIVIEVRKVKRSVVDQPSKYARVVEWFDLPYIVGKDPERMRYYLRRVEEQCNAILRDKGVITLDEVYERIGLPTLTWRQEETRKNTGWILDENYDQPLIDFGIYKDYNSDFINGYEAKVILDFNVNAEDIDA